MKLEYFILVTLLVVSCAQAGDTPTSLDVKLGLWEVTTTTTMSGQAPMPPEKLAKLNPEQRASLKKSMAGPPSTDTHKECVTSEKLKKSLLFGEDHEGCSRTFVTSSSTKIEAKLHCQRDQAQTEGTMKLDVLNSESVKGDMDAIVTSGKRTMNMHVAFSSKYLTSSCGSVEP